MIPAEIANMKPLTGEEKLERDSEYMGADDIALGTEPILTIKHIYRGTVTLSRGKETKNVLTFVESSVPGITEVRPLIVNSTNRQTLKKLYKQVTADALEGKKIQLYIQTGVRNPSKNELTNGIRIREFIPKDGKAAKTLKCSSCGKEISGMSGFTAEQIAANTKQKYGKQLCIECGQKAKAAMESAAKAETTSEDVKNEKSGLAEQLTAGLE